MSRSWLWLLSRRCGFMRRFSSGGMGFGFGSRRLRCRRSRRHRTRIAMRCQPRDNAGHVLIGHRMSGAVVAPVGHALRPGDGDVAQLLVADQTEIRRLDDRTNRWVLHSLAARAMATRTICVERLLPRRCFRMQHGLIGRRILPAERSGAAPCGYEAVRKNLDLL